MGNEQDLKVTTFVKLDMVDRMRVLFGRAIKVETKIIVPFPDGFTIGNYNAHSTTELISSTGVFTKQDRPPFGYMAKMD